MSVSSKELGELASLQHEIFLRVKEGTFPAKNVIRNLQNYMKSLHKELYVDEVVPSDEGYPEGFQYRSAKAQINMLKRLFPYLEFPDSVEARYEEPLLEGAEGKVIIPDPYAIVSGMGIKHKMSEIEAYSVALNEVMKKMVEHFGDRFRDQDQYDSEEFIYTPSTMKLFSKTMEAFAYLRNTQGSVWTVDSQFGKKFAGHSVLSAMVRFTDNEFGWGPYETCIQLLTHPDRLLPTSSLGIFCAGCGWDRYFGSQKYEWHFTFYEGGEVIHLLCPPINHADEYPNENPGSGVNSGFLNK